MHLHPFFIWFFPLLLLVIAIIVAIYICKRKKSPCTSASLNNAIDNQIYVGNLPYRIREDEIVEFFAEYGRVEEAKIVKNVKTGRSRGYAFVTFLSAVDAEKALKAHGMRVKGRKMIVRIAKIPKKSSPIY